jgi:hypothetical protein
LSGFSDLVCGTKISLEYIPAPNVDLDPNALALWRERIVRMSTEIYPILFKDVLPDDLESIEQIINVSNKNNPSPARLEFDSRLRALLSLDDAVSLTGLV